MIDGLQNRLVRHQTAIFIPLFSLKCSSFPPLSWSKGVDVEVRRFLPLSPAFFFFPPFGADTLLGSGRAHVVLPPRHSFFSPPFSRRNWTFAKPRSFPPSSFSSPVFSFPPFSLPTQRAVVMSRNQRDGATLFFPLPFFPPLLSRNSRGGAWRGNSSLPLFVVFSTLARKSAISAATPFFFFFFAFLFLLLLFLRPRKLADRDERARFPPFFPLKPFSSPPPAHLPGLRREMN